MARAHVELKGLPVGELMTMRKELGERYLGLSRRRAIEGKREVDEECRRVDVELWLVKQELKRREREGA